LLGSLIGCLAATDCGRLPTVNCNHGRLLIVVVVVVVVNVVVVNVVK
jgi:hypothetical protein